MGGDQAAKTLLQIQVNAMKAKGQEVKPEEEKKLLSDIINRYETQTTPYYAAARLWVDDIIDPLQTRNVISEAIKAANNNPDVASLKLGVFQV
jgi:3-methylcrotonyl-CoA carboxylase beta subunit